MSFMHKGLRGPEKEGNLPTVHSSTPHPVQSLPKAPTEQPTSSALGPHPPPELHLTPSQVPSEEGAPGRSTLIFI